MKKFYSKLRRAKKRISEMEDRLQGFIQNAAESRIFTYVCKEIENIKD